MAKLPGIMNPSCNSGLELEWDLEIELNRNCELNDSALYPRFQCPGWHDGYAVPIMLATLVDTKVAKISF